MAYSRFNDAVLIQAGACNPVAISRALVRAIDSARAENQDTDSICKDSAVRLICHQLAHLFNLRAFDMSIEGVDDYSRALAECEARKAEATPTAQPETAGVYSCVSVVGGWQTRNNATGELIGPVFNATTDLWAWQELHLYRGAEPELVLSFDGFGINVNGQRFATLARTVATPPAPGSGEWGEMSDAERDLIGAQIAAAPRTIATLSDNLELLREENRALRAALEAK